MLFVFLLAALKNWENEYKWEQHTQVRNNDDIRHLYEVIEDQLGSACAIWLPPIVGNTVFHVTSTILQLFQRKGIFGVPSYEDPHDHIYNFVGVGHFVLRRSLKS